MRDLASRGPYGRKTETIRYYYVPDGHGGIYRETGVIACTVRGAIGPFTMTREVVYGEWELDAADERANQ